MKKTYGFMVKYRLQNNYIILSLTQEQENVKKNPEYADNTIK